MELLDRSTAVLKVAGSSPAKTIDCKTLSVHPAVNGYTVTAYGRKGMGDLYNNLMKES